KQVAPRKAGTRPRGVGKLWSLPMSTVATPSPAAQPAVTPRFPGFLTMSDQQLIDVIADPFTMPGEDADAIVDEASRELCRRLDAYDPTPAERRAIEEDEEPERYDLCD